MMASTILMAIQFDTNGRYFACFDAALEETRKAGMTMGYCEPACIFTMSEMRADHPELQAVSLKCERIDVESGERIDVPEAFFSVAAELGEEGNLDSDSLRLLSAGEQVISDAVDVSDGIEAHLHELPRMAVWDEGGFRMHIQQRVIGGHIFYWLCNNDSQPREGVLRLKGAQGSTDASGDVTKGMAYKC